MSIVNCGFADLAIVRVGECLMLMLLMLRNLAVEVDLP